MGPENSFLYLGPNNTDVGYALYGGNSTKFLMSHFRQPGKKEGSMYVNLICISGRFLPHNPLQIEVLARVERQGL